MIKFGNEKGFTLVEMLIVIAIIAILAAVAAPRYLAYRQTASINTCISNQASLQTALEQFAFSDGSYPGGGASSNESAMIPTIIKAPITCPDATNPSATAPGLTWSATGIVTCTVNAAQHVQPGASSST